MTYKCLLLRWGFAPDPKVYRFTPQGLLCRYHRRHHNLAGKKSDTVQYRPLGDQSALGSHLCVALSSELVR